VSDRAHQLQDAPATEEEMMVEIFKYTERVVNMVRPRRMLFMAIGGYHQFLHLFLLFGAYAVNFQMVLRRVRK
jgi:hypothetical protein